MDVGLHRDHVELVGYLFKMYYIEEMFLYLIVDMFSCYHEIKKNLENIVVR